MTAGIPEAAATGEVAAIYADIRATLGVAMVNLVWRHLATREGALAACWTRARPLYADGSARAAAQRLAAGLPWPPIAPLSPPALAAAGLDPAAATDVRRLLAAYERANAVNLLVLTALRESFAGAVPATGAPPAPPADGSDPGAGTLEVPALPAPAPEALDVATRSTVLALSAFGAAPGAPVAVVATVLRQLAAWPRLLELLQAQVAPCIADGGAACLVDALGAGATAQARHLAARLPRTPPADAPAIAAMLAPFLDGTLLRMVALVPLLRRALGD